MTFDGQKTGGLQLIRSLRDQVLQQWGRLSRTGRFSLAIVSLLLVVSLTVAIGMAVSSRDEGSYQFGRTAISIEARIVLQGGRQVEARSGARSTVRGPEDACRLTVETDLDMDDSLARSLGKMDIGDVIEGCTDVLQEEERLGFGGGPTARPSGTATPTPGRAPPSSSRQLPEPSNAGNVLRRAETRLQWSGSRCIQIESARQSDRTRTGVDRICSNLGTWRFAEEASSGQLFGGDPIMGEADWIACQVYLDGRLEYSDRADAGDGTDVTCLRKLN